MNISLREVLDIRYPSDFEWSPDGRFLSFVWYFRGIRDLYLIPMDSKEIKQLTVSDGNVRTYSWNKESKLIAYQKDEDIYYVDVNIGKPVSLVVSSKKCRNPRWSPVSNELAYIMDNDIWLYSFDSHTNTQLTKSGNVEDFKWSKDGGKIAFKVGEKGKSGWKIFSIKDGEIIWESEDGLCESLIWMPNGKKVLYSLADFNYISRRYLLADIEENVVEEILTEKDERGLLFEVPPIVSNKGNKVIFVLLVDGWTHLWLKDLENGELVQLTRGECEDIGCEGDSPVWTPNDDLIVFSSSRKNLTERHIWSVKPDGSDLEMLIPLDGTSVFPKVSPDGEKIVFLHSDPYEAPDIWMFDTKTRDVEKLTNSMPKTLTKEKIVAPKIVTYSGAKNWKIYACLFVPPNLEKGKKYPAIVWLHGGPIRQMVRNGWHPMQIYSLFYSFHQLLVHKGYVVLFIDYRGSIGYGREFMQGIYREMGVSDVIDVVKAVDYLKSLGFVDKERIGVWGISYGGYLTLQVLTKYPDVFKAGVNIAGVTDFESWMKWAEENYVLAAAFFRAKLGGNTSKNKSLYMEASAINFIKNIKVPLLNLHGTADEAVTFKQLDELIKALVKEGKHFEVMYYPEEKHAFEKAETWLDAFNRVMKFFEENI